MNIKITTKKTEELRKRVRTAYAEFKTYSQAGNDQQARTWHERWSTAMEAQNDVLDPIKEEVENALEAVNGRATSHTITTYAAVRAIAMDAEKMLDEKCVTQKNRVDTIATYRPSGPRANAYKYAAKSTLVTVRRVADGWRLVNVAEASVHPKQSASFKVVISVAARNDILRNALDGITVRQEVET